MSELEAIRESLQELEGLTKEALLDALFQAHRELTRVERLRDQWQQSDQVSSNQRDLYRRRADLAAAICRDDEGGLGRNELDRIAAVIWPTPIDPTAVPTPAQVPRWTQDTEYVDFINRAARLLGVAEGLIEAIKNALPPGFELGVATTGTMEKWKAESQAWRLTMVRSRDGV